MNSPDYAMYADPFGDLNNRIVDNTELVLSAQQLLAHQHEQLLTTLLSCGDSSEPTLDVKALPLDSQRLVWRLYSRYYPDFAPLAARAEHGGLALAI